MSYGNAQVQRGSPMYEFLTDVCIREDFTFASNNSRDNPVYTHSYKLLSQIVQNKLLSDGASDQSPDQIIQSFRNLQNNNFNKEVIDANQYFATGSDYYENFLQEISVGRAWPIALYMHMQEIHARWPHWVPDISTIGLDSSISPERRKYAPVVNKDTTFECIELLLEAFNENIRATNRDARLRLISKSQQT